MKIRSYKKEDAAAVDDIYSRCHGHFNLPDINYCLGLAVIENDEGQVIALGALQIIPEAILVLDKDRPKREQVEALKELLSNADIIAELKGFSQYYAFPDTEPYANVLRKHFGFRDAEKILIKRINNGEQERKENDQHD